MALTRPRAAQIYDIDYKQATRVVTVVNITLSGSAPNQVDGVNLSLNDRVLVTGQSTLSQNGIYYVTTLGSGSNGTWSRSLDTNNTGEILTGTIVMVTEGVIYADTQWKLITDGIIDVGVTDQEWTQNYSANSISSGNSNVIVNSNANVTISSAGTSNVAVFANTGEYVTGVISASGNITGNYFLGNVFFANGITASKIYNGNSEVNVVSSGGNVNVTVGGTSNVAVFTTAGEYVTGIISATGNVSGNYILGNGSQLTGLPESYGNANVAAYLPTYTGNLAGGNLSVTSDALISGNLSVVGNATLSGNILGDRIINGNTSIEIQTASGNANVSVGGTSNVVVFASTGEYVTGILSATGNITGNYIFGNGYNLTGINAFSSITVSGQNTIVANSIASSLTFAAGNSIEITTSNATGIVTIAYTSSGGSSIFATGGDMGLVTEAVTSSEDLGLVTDNPPSTSYDLGQLGVDGVVINDNIVANTITGNKFASNIVITTTGNITAANVSATGNVTGGNLIVTGLEYITPNYITVSANGTSNLSQTATTNILLVTTTNLTATLNMPTSAGNGQICSFAVSGNTVTLVVGTGTVNSTFAGSTTVGTTFKYVYNTGTTIWYRII